MRSSSLFLIFPLLLLSPVGCSSAAGEVTEASEQHDTAAQPTTKTPIDKTDFTHDDILLPSEPMARLIVPNTNAAARCGLGVPVIGANEAGRLLVDGPKLLTMAPSFTEEEHDAFQLECLADMPFQVMSTPSRPTPDEILLVLDLVSAPENLKLEVVDANDKPLFTSDDLATFIEQVRSQIETDTGSAPIEPYSEILRQQEILDRVLASSPATYIARQYTRATTERWDFADGHCEIVTSKDTNVTLLSPNHFGIELDLSRLTKHTETHDPACTVTR